MNNSQITVTEVINIYDFESIKNPTFDGFHLNKFKENLSDDGESDTTINHILSNAYQAIGYFKKPSCQTGRQNPTKILCLGKVQSGKTSFFLATTALAFDNGYDVAYILGGTKLKLKQQNLGRIIDSFKNNEKIKIFDVNSSFNVDISELIEQGYKIILVILKNAAENTNLGKLKQFSDEYKDIPAVIIDDEGDESTPGAERQKRKNSRVGKTHDRIVEIITSFEICTFLTVTATPQANLLVSTFDGISPNRLVLVRPGNSYTGGHAFFDIKENSHISLIRDEDDFIDAIPTSFKEALNFFIFSCALKRSKKDFKPLSMLVHPSSFSAIQNIVAERVNNYINNNIRPIINNPTSIEFDDLIIQLGFSLIHYIKINGNCDCTMEEVANNVIDVIRNLKVQVINYANPDDGSDSDDGHIYKIKVGGNMLGRGLTIDRLIVSYIYRDSKEAQVDTMYQRCRWFGYKKSYFDVCVVYMTSELQNKFMAIVSNEDHMWNSMEAFLDSQIDLKKFKRVFLLDHDKLILTRRSVANTITLKVISSGNKPDECIDLTDEQKENNRNIYLSYVKNHEHEGELVDFDNSIDHKQRHLLIKTNFTSFYDEFLSKLVYGYGSPFSVSVFQALVERIKKGDFKDEILVMFVRYGLGEHRSPSDSTMMNISRLFQGRNDGTSFTGDRYPIDIEGNDYSKRQFIQVHMIDLNNSDPVIEESIPLIAYNNPFTSDIIKMVTGDNVYEE